MPAAEDRLLNEVRRGNEEAFVTLYQRYGVGLFRFAWRMTGSIEVAEDVTQDCFLSLARGSSFDDRRGRLQTYLFGTARHLIFRHLRHSGRKAEEFRDTATACDVLDDLLVAERSELVRQAIANLPVLQREAIILFEYEELSLSDIANATGANVGTIKARLCRARESLRKQLHPLLSLDTERNRS